MECKVHAGLLKARLKENRLKATPARLLLLDVFEHAKKPLSVFEILEKLGEADKATVYRNLESLKGLGLVKQIRLKDRQAYFETNAHHHHHVVCTHCGKIRDVESCKILASQEKLLKDSGFAEITDHSLEFYGVCSACKK